MPNHPIRNRLRILLLLAAIGLGYFRFCARPGTWEVEGDYVIESDSRSKMHYPDSLANHTVLSLHDDGTFTASNLPQYDDLFSMQYTLVRSRGEWTVELDQGRWALNMHFDTIYDAASGKFMSNGLFTNIYEVERSGVGVNIYQIVGDPDAGEGITFVKQTSD